MLYCIVVWFYDPSGTSATYYVPQLSYMAVPDCPALYMRHFRIGHDSMGHSYTLYMRWMYVISHCSVAL